MDLALCSHSAARTSNLPTSFSTAETGNLRLACSVVLKCVTGAKWVPALASAEIATQIGQEKGQVPTLLMMLGYIHTNGDKCVLSSPF